MLGPARPGAVRAVDVRQQGGDQIGLHLGPVRSPSAELPDEREQPLHGVPVDTVQMGTPPRRAVPAVVAPGEEGVGGGAQHLLEPRHPGQQPGHDPAQRVQPPPDDHLARLRVGVPLGEELPQLLLGRHQIGGLHLVAVPGLGPPGADHQQRGREPREGQGAPGAVALVAELVGDGEEQIGHRGRVRGVQPGAVALVVGRVRGVRQIHPGRGHPRVIAVVQGVQQRRLAGGPAADDLHHGLARREPPLPPRSAARRHPQQRRGQRVHDAIEVVQAAPHRAPRGSPFPPLYPANTPPMYGHQAIQR